MPRKFASPNPRRPTAFFTAAGLAILLAVNLAAAAQAESGVSFAKGDGKLAIALDGRPLATYVWQDAETLRPYFTDLHTPSGAKLTRNHPPIEGVDATDHAALHPGLWLAFGDLSGADFWRNKATVKHAGFVEEPATSQQGGTFAVRNRYEHDGKLVCEEVCRIRISSQSGGTLIDWESRFSGPADFYFGDQEEMGLGVRMATPLTVKNGGEITNSDGGKNEKQVWGQQAAWCDYSGVINGQPAGVMIMPAADNSRRSWFHARDYGLLVANPFGENAFTKGPKSRVTVRPGDALRLRFGVLLHSGPFDPQAAYRQWQQLTK